jgi:hypothetical protein
MNVLVSVATYGVDSAASYYSYTKERWSWARYIAETVERRAAKVAAVACSCGEPVYTRAERAVAAAANSMLSARALAVRRPLHVH